jgi:hypothetical protein
MLSHSFGVGRSKKIVASAGFTSSYMAFCESIFYGTPYVELFCQMIYQNGSSSTDRVVHGAEAPQKWLHW